VLKIKRAVHEKEVTKWRKFRGRYETVSHAWGRDTATVEISCGDGTTNSRLLITKAMDAMLRHLRLQQKPRYLWIDAICINHSDKAEKSSQISSIRSIYEEAKRMILWTGDDGGGGEAVLRLLRKLKDRDSMASIQRKLTTVFGHTSIEPVHQFISRAWFKRWWVVEEIVLAREARIMCGSRSMEFDKFYNALCTLYARGNVEAGNGLDLVDWIGAIHRMRRNRIRQPPSQWPLLNMLVRFHQADCSNDHDRIVSMLGMGLNNFGLTIDYNAPIEDLYRQFARSALIEERNMDIKRRSSHVYLPVDGIGPERLTTYGLDVLNAAGAFRSTYESLPSWVPDWRATMRFRPLYDLAGGVEKAPLSFRNRTIPIREVEDCLLLAGSAFATVTAVGEALPTNHTLEQLAKYIQKWWKLYNERQPNHSGQRESDILFFTTITANKMTLELNKIGGIMTRAQPAQHNSKQARDKPKIIQTDTESASSGSDMDKDYKGEKSHSNSVVKLFVTLQGRFGSKRDAAPTKAHIENEVNRGKTVPKRQQHMDDKTSEFYDFVSLVMAGRCCFTTDTGDFGIGPGDMEAGDVVMILDGGQTPFVLRPTDAPPKSASRVRSIDSMRSMLSVPSSSRKTDSFVSQRRVTWQTQSVDNLNQLMKAGGHRRTSSAVSSSGERFQLLGDCYVDGVTSERVKTSQGSGGYAYIRLH
jgi:hypothetical protein